MKTILEQISPDTNSSFHLILTPRLNDVFLWHYHPEYEIVFITGANGTRHVGNHISHYEGSDLVFIGPNIPHLNFDYGVKTDHRKVVVQLKESFLGTLLTQAPEFVAIAHCLIWLASECRFMAKQNGRLASNSKPCRPASHLSG